MHCEHQQGQRRSTKEWFTWRYLNCKYGSKQDELYPGNLLQTKNAKLKAKHQNETVILYEHILLTSISTSDEIFDQTSNFLHLFLSGSLGRSRRIWFCQLQVFHFFLEIFLQDTSKIKEINEGAAHLWLK